MIRIIMSIGLLLSENLFAALIIDGTTEYSKDNKIKAMNLWIQACDGGDMEGCYFAGIRYDEGDGVSQDRVKARELYTKSCNGGSMGGCYLLGQLYANGHGVRQDKSRAKELFGLACDKGNEGGCERYKILNEEGVK